MTRVARGLRGFALFWWDFIVGDDWRIAAGVVLALAGTAVIATTSVPAWWLVPVAVAVLLAVSLWRATGPLTRGGGARVDVDAGP